MALWFLVFCWLAEADKVFLNGTGPFFLDSFLDGFAVTFKALFDEPVDFHYTTLGNQAILDEFGATTDYNFGFLDPYSEIPASAWGNPAYYLFPMFVDTLVPIVNLQVPRENQLILSRQVLADIFMGNILYWNDTLIQNLNQFSLPNEPITVLYLGDQPTNLFWTEALSSFSSSWTYGINSTWPEALTHLPNFIEVDPEVQDGMIQITPFSISYLSPKNAGGNFNYARLINQAGNVVGFEGEHSTEAMFDVTLDENFSGDYGIDGKSEMAWPLGTYVYLILPKDYKHEDCDDSRGGLLWTHWIYESSLAQFQAIESDFGFITEDIRAKVIIQLENITCNEEAFLAGDDSAGYVYQLESFFALSMILLVLSLLLACAQIWSFRRSKINLIYSSVFMVGIFFSFISTIFWHQDAVTDSQCQSRVWTLSIGFTILLGTMFSRTWQLREIYLLQQKPLEQLRNNISVRGSLIKLVFTLSTVILLDLLLLILWQGIDPYKAKFAISDELNLIGEWNCTSNYLAGWLSTQIAFMGALIAFGIYVIYQTWSFHNLVETRWVLLALYNVVINIIGLLPFFAVQPPSGDFLGLVVTISVDFSATGIICAVLLPRLVEKFEQSRSDKQKGITAETDRTKPVSGGKAFKVDPSRTPEEYLAERLQNPQPLHIDTQLKRISPGNISPVDYGSPVDHSRLDHSRLESETAQLSPTKPQELADYMRINTNYDISTPEVELTPAPDAGDSDTGMKKKDFQLIWSQNPIVEEE